MWNRRTTVRPVGCAIKALLGVGSKAQAIGGIGVLMLGWTGCIEVVGGDISPSPTSTDSYQAELQLCVNTINQYRSTTGKKPLEQSAELEAFAAEGAQHDGSAHSPHGHFKATNGGGVAKAENEIPWWSLNDHGTVRNILLEGLQMMWDEGPGGPHYETMNGGYSAVGCGIFVNGDEVTIVQDFR